MKWYEILLIIIGVPFWPLFLIISLFVSDAKSIVILGHKNSGKSTLWEALGGIPEAKPNTPVDKIQSFEITRSDGSVVEVSETMDIGGEDEYVPLYESLIKEGSFIYYLVDANRLEEEDLIRRVRSDLTKINNVVKKKGISKDSIGIKFLLTHYDSYKISHPESNEHRLFYQFYNKIVTMKNKGLLADRITPEQYEKVMGTVNLMDERDINRIKDEIGG
jgi:energy-coupling factor transporter ATP-binding protein EcfA2